MKKTTFVALLLIYNIGFAAGIQDILAGIEADWTKVFYQTPQNQQPAAYQQLLVKTGQLSQQRPEVPELLFWHAVVKASYAERQSPLDALNSVIEAKDLLTKLISIKPDAMEGAAYVTLATLYAKVPGWPIAFGDVNKANELFQLALKLNPSSIEGHYFYGEFLAASNRLEEAERHFTMAANSPNPDQNYTDYKLQEDAQNALLALKSPKSVQLKKLLAPFAQLKKS